ncbi:MAG: 50S ribosomal protein L33 [Candidatus Doudnabacteria bacterium]|nr:50S ribosomal protein L33 [Candidatus Doudnabacteria bacterium]
MSQETLIKMQCTVCKRINYQTHKNKKNTPEALEIKKFCKWDRKHTLHKELKK